MDNKKYGLVFAGGGTRGAYQVGVSMALKELRINIGAVTGCSIGSINGALYVMNEVNTMKKIYDNVSITDVLEISEKHKLNNTTNLFTFENLLKVGGEFIQEKGISNEPLARTVDKYINVDKIYNSKIDFGIITYDVKKGGVELFKEDIPKEDMKSYILASACFPIFKPQKIGNSKYLDGGISDNMPINMLIKKGYKNIIAININGVGLIRRVNSPDVYIKVITPDGDLGGPFDFDHENIEKNILYGYYDTLKAFHKVYGNYFYFKRYDFDRFLNHFSVNMIYGLESAGKLLGLDRFRFYTYKEYIRALMTAFEKEESKYKKLKKDINLRAIPSIIKEGYRVSLALDIITNYPSLYANNTVRGMLNKYFEAAMAVQEVRNTLNSRMWR